MIRETAECRYGMHKLCEDKTNCECECHNG